MDTAGLTQTWQNIYKRTGNIDLANQWLESQQTASMDTGDDYLGDIGGWDEVKWTPPWGTRLPPKPGKPPWGGPSEFDMAENSPEYLKFKSLRRKFGEARANEMMEMNVNRGGIMGVI